MIHWTITAVIAVFCAIAGSSATAEAENRDPVWIGSAPFDFAAKLRTPGGLPVSGNVDTLICKWVPTAMGMPCRVRVQVVLPGCVACVGGDTVAMRELNVETRQDVRSLTTSVTPASPGQGVIEATATFTYPGNRCQDTVVLWVPISVVGGQIKVTAVEEPIPTRLCSNGIWRWSPDILIPVETAEPVLEEELATHRKAISRTTMQAVDCDECAKGDAVSFVLAIDKDGRMLGARHTPLVGQGEHSEDVIAEAKARLGATSWSPASFRGHAVGDWAFVTVPLRPQ
jgi:hypothetical protein